MRRQKAEAEPRRTRATVARSGPPIIARNGGLPARPAARRLAVLRFAPHPPGGPLPPPPARWRAGVGRPSRSVLPGGSAVARPPLPSCSCSPACVSPSSCPCVFSGRAVWVSFACGLCGGVSAGVWPRGWRALRLVCPFCPRPVARWVSFAGLPAALRARVLAAPGPACAAPRPAARPPVPGARSAVVGPAAVLALALGAVERRLRAEAGLCPSLAAP